METSSANTAPIAGRHAELPIAAILGHHADALLPGRVADDDDTWMLTPPREQTIWPRVWPGL